MFSAVQGGGEVGIEYNGGSGDGEMSSLGYILQQSQYNLLIDWK